MPLLTTKLYIPPVGPELVSRPRLVERLDAGLRHKMTLISAPAGFGKTTLVSEWIHRMGEVASPMRIAWLSLDENDNAPDRFLAYFIAALQTTAASVGKAALSTLQAPQPPQTEAILTILMNEIAAIADRVVLVLDDYHLIEARPIHNALTFLLRHLPPQMHLVVATRDDPQLPLARLRARGQLTELRAADLRFTTSEAAEFLNQVMGLDLSAADVAALETRTEGWIAGLQLAAISMQGHKDVAAFIASFTGSHHFVLDYLVEEVLQQQSESIQTFLLRTSILDRLCGPLCDAVSPDPSASGQETLEHLEHANLFIVPLDEERRWYRYHHLFADLLRQRQRRAEPEQLPTLHHRASEWYEQFGSIDEAIEHALCAEDFGRAAHLLEAHVDDIWQRGEHTKLRRWLARLPAELVFSRPHLCILHAWNLFTSGQQDAAEQSLQAAEQVLDLGADRAPRTSLTEREQLPGSEQMQIQGRAAAIRAFLASYRGDTPGIIRYARRALEYLPEQDVTWRSTAAIALGDAYSFKGDALDAYRVRLEALDLSKAAGNPYMILIASMKLAITMRQQGRLGQVNEICQEQLQLADERGVSHTVVVGWLLAIWGEALAELNDLDRATRHVMKGVRLAERGQDVMVIGWSNLCLIRVLFSRGDISGAEGIIQKLDKIARKKHVPPWITNLLAAWQVRIWLAQDRLEAAAQWVRERGLDTDGDLTYLHEMEYIVLARILIAQGRLAQAAWLLQRLLEATEAGGRTSRVIQVLMLQVLVFQTEGDTTRAMVALERALTLAEPEGFVRTFVDEGPPMARLLYEAATRGIAPDYCRRLLAAFPVAQPDQIVPSTGQASSSELVEPLSKRELEVLRLIAEGLTNPEIAATLFLSLNTVKAHTRNIYGKLGAHSRTQAAARARTLGILPT